MTSIKLFYFGIMMQRPSLLEKTLMLGKVDEREEEDEQQHHGRPGGPDQGQKGDGENLSNMAKISTSI